MKKLLSLSVMSVMAFLLVFSFVGAMFSQVDDPTKDALPESFYRNLPPVIMSPMATITIGDYDNFDMGVDYAEGHISMNPKNPLQTFNCWNITATHHSEDGGLTWAMNNPSFPTSAGDPVSAYDSLGNLYYETMKSPISGCWVAKSTNNGATWLWANVTGVSGNDKNWIAADQTGGPYANYLYSVMTSGSAASFWRSTDQGATFSQTATLTPHSFPGAMVCVGPNGGISGGHVYAVTHLGPNGAGTYTFHRSSNGGLNFTTASSVQWSNIIGNEVSGRSTVASMRTRPYPWIAADNSFGTYRGRLYCVYASNEPAGSGNKSDVFCRYSTDYGTTWSSRITINDDVNTQLNNQYHPSIWCDKQTGRLYAMWYDTRNAPGNDSIDVYASYSTNGGQTWVANQRITNKKFRIAFANQSPPSYQGDYNSIVSNAKTSMVLWADFRNNSYGSYAGYFPDFAFRLNPLQDSINSANGSVYVRAVVPATKLWSDTVYLTSTITPTPAAGSFAITYPSGNWVKNPPDSNFVKVTATNVTPGIYTLNVKALGFNGTPVHVRTMTLIAGSTVTGIGGNESSYSYKLEQNFPNPFNPITKINYTIAKPGNVKITVFNTLGKEVTTYAVDNQMPGNHFVVFNARGLSSGVYYYRIQTAEFTDTKKMMLLK